MVERIALQKSIPTMKKGLIARGRDGAGDASIKTNRNFCQFGSLFSQVSLALHLRIYQTLAKICHALECH